MARLIRLSVPYDTLEFEYQTKFVMGDYGSLEGIKYDIDIYPKMNEGLFEDSIMISKSNGISLIHTNYYSDIELAYDAEGGIVRFSTKTQGDSLSNYMEGVIIDPSYQTNGGSAYEVFIRYMFRAYKMNRLEVPSPEDYSDPGGDEGGE